MYPHFMFNKDRKVQPYLNGGKSPSYLVILSVETYKSQGFDGVFNFETELLIDCWSVQKMALFWHIVCLKLVPEFMAILIGNEILNHGSFTRLSQKPLWHIPII